MQYGLSKQTAFVFAWFPGIGSKWGSRLTLVKNVKGTGNLCPCRKFTFFLQELREILNGTQKNDDIFSLYDIK